MSGYTPEPRPGVMTLPEVAAFLRCSESTIYRLLKRRQIPSFRVASNHRFMESTIRRWVEGGAK